MAGSQGESKEGEIRENYGKEDVFMAGFGMAVIGVIALSKQIGAEPLACSARNPSSTSL